MEKVIELLNELSSYDIIETRNDEQIVLTKRLKNLASRSLAIYIAQVTSVIAQLRGMDNVEIDTSTKGELKVIIALNNDENEQE